MKSFIIALTITLLLPIGYANATDRVETLRERIAKNVVERIENRRDFLQRRQKQRKLVVEQVVVDNHHYGNFHLQVKSPNYLHSEDVRIIVPQRIVRYQEIPDLSIIEDSYGQQVITKERVIAPQKQVLRVEVDGGADYSGGSQCVISVERLRSHH